MKLNRLISQFRQLVHEYPEKGEQDVRIIVELGNNGDEGRVVASIVEIHVNGEVTELRGVEG